MRLFVVKGALRTVNIQEQPHTSCILFPFNRNRRCGVEGFMLSWSSAATSWLKINTQPNQAKTRCGMRDRLPLYLPVRISEQISGICCPRRGQQVPRGLGHCQTGHLHRPSGPHNQPVRVNTSVPDAPPGISCSSRMILADTFLILSWHFSLTFGNAISLSASQF